MMRVVIGLLLAANIVAAVLAFKPFRRLSEDLRREQADFAPATYQLQTRGRTQGSW